ncbi:MAG: CDP-alcohol phosphatidyltransferase family protein [Oscillospiraceae bacterium]
MKINIRDITKIPNLLSLLRIALIPVFVVVFLWENGEIRYSLDIGEEANGYVIAAAIVVLSGLTDAADGFIARRFNMITDLGKVLDPFADKLTQAAVVVCLFFRYKEIWELIAALLLLIVVKEIAMLVMGVVFLKKGQDLGGAKWFGKLATIVFYVLVIILLGAPYVSILAAFVMISVMIVFTSLAFALYLREYYLLWREGKLKTGSDRKD